MVQWRREIKQSWIFWYPQTNVCRLPGIKWEDKAMQSSKVSLKCQCKMYSCCEENKALHFHFFFLLIKMLDCFTLSSLVMKQTHYLCSLSPCVLLSQTIICLLPYQNEFSVISNILKNKQTNKKTLPIDTTTDDQISCWVHTNQRKGSLDRIFYSGFD